MRGRLHRARSSGRRRASRGRGAVGRSPPGSCARRPRRSPPTRASTVPSGPGLRPARPRGSRTGGWLVVVFPLVPVTPTTSSSRVGSPEKTSAAARHRGGASPTTTAAPQGGRALRDERRPRLPRPPRPRSRRRRRVLRAPPKKSAPGMTRARVVREIAHVDDEPRHLTGSSATARRSRSIRQNVLVRGDEHAGSVTGFVLATFAFFVAMVGTTLPTPLYPLFEQRYWFGSLLVTVIFAIYAFGVITGLILFGNLSDRLGRKRLLVLGLVLSAASALLFSSPARSSRSRRAHRLRALGRDFRRDGDRLHHRPRSRRPPPAGELRRRLRQSRRAGGGTLLSGLLAEWAPHALRTPFAVDLVLVTVATAGLLLPGGPSSAGVQLRAQRLGVRRCGRLRRAALAVSAGSPSPVSSARSRPSSSVWVFIASPRSRTARLRPLRLLCRRPGAHRAPFQRARGRVRVLVAGVAVLAVSLATDSLAALFASAVVGGLGQGVVVSAGLAAIAERAPAERRGETARASSSSSTSASRCR